MKMKTILAIAIAVALTQTAAAEPGFRNPESGYNGGYCHFPPEHYRSERDQRLCAAVRQKRILRGVGK